METLKKAWRSIKGLFRGKRKAKQYVVNAAGAVIEAFFPGEVVANTVILLAGTQEEGGGGEAPVSVTHYAAPTAQGLGDGSSAANAFTITDFLALPPSPGDHVQLADGTYTSTGGLLQPTGISGTATAYITVSAKNEGSVLFDGQDTDQPIYLSNSSYWNVIGVNAKNGRTGCIRVVNSSVGNYFQRCCAWDAGGASINVNCSVFDASNSWGNVFEDCFAFGHGRRMFNMYESGNPAGQPSNSPITNAAPNYMRRCFGIGSRWEGTTKKVYQLGYEGYNDIAENCVAMYDAEGYEPSQGGEWRGLFCFGRLERFPTFPDSNSKFLGCLGLILPGAQNLGGYIDQLIDGFGGITYPNQVAGGNEFRDIILYAGEATNENRLIRLQYYQGSPGEYTDSTEIGPGAGNGSTGDGTWTITNRSTNASIAVAPNPFQTTSGTGGRMYYKTVAGTLTTDPLWPWPMNTRMNSALTASGRTPSDIWGGYASFQAMVEGLWNVSLG